MMIDRAKPQQTHYRTLWTRGNRRNNSGHLGAVGGGRKFAANAEKNGPQSTVSRNQWLIAFALNILFWRNGRS
jgi:hypothetical protein